MMSENKYRVFHKSVKGIRKLYPVESLVDTAIDKIETDPESDYYESIYVYTDEHKHQLEQTRTLAGIRGIKIDRIVFDFDNKDVNLALQDSRTLVSRLTEFPTDSIRAFFSGSKGMHVEIHLDKFLSREQFETIIDFYAGDLETFDTRIKDEQRLFRFPLTKHNKTGLFKIPLTLNQLNNLNVDEIKSLAREIRPEFYDLMNSYTTTTIDETKYQPKKVEVKEVSKTAPQQGPDMSKRRKELTPAKYALEQGFFEEGERNEACMILASTYKYLGYNQEHTYNIIKATLRLRTERLGLPDYDKSELWNTIIEPIYSPTWKGGTFTEEDGLLKRTIDRYNLNDISVSDVTLVDLNSLSAHFLDFATNIDANTIKLGIDEIDNKIRITTSSLVAFLAAPSAGKSSVSFGILNTLSKSDESAIFFSMDMSIPQVYQRIIQRHTGHDEDTIMNNYKEKNIEQISKYQECMHQEYKNVKFCFRSGMSAKDVRDTLLTHQQSTGRLPRLVILDYLECMRADGISDSTQSKAQIATELKGIANELGVCIILLVQPRMMAGGPAGELNSYTDIKGSSVISEAAAQVITMSRPGFSPKDPENDNYVTINVVKNRMGKLSSTDLHWNGLTGHIRALSTEEKRDLNNLRAELASKSDGGGDPDEMYASKTSGSKRTGNNRFGNGGNLY